MEDFEWAVTQIDAGCDCCSYLVRALFHTREEAERWVAEARDPSNYEIGEW